LHTGQVRLMRFLSVYEAKSMGEGGVPRFDWLAGAAERESAVVKSRMCVIPRTDASPV